MPALSKARENARRAYCINNLRQIGLALQMYASDNDGFFPRGGGVDGCGPQATIRGSAFGGLIGAGRLLPYLGNNLNIFVCPSADRIKIDIIKKRLDSDYLVVYVPYLYDGWYSAKSTREKNLEKKVKMLDLNVEEGGDQNTNHNFEVVNLLYADGHVKQVFANNYPGLKIPTSSSEYLISVFDVANSIPE